MIIALWVAAAALAAVLLFVLSRMTEQRAGVKYITGKLEEMNRNGVPVQLLHPSGDPDIQALLAAMNSFLTGKDKEAAQFKMTEAAMRRMLANVSHDLKTPLTVVLGYLETLHRRPDLPPDKREELLGKVHGKGLEVISLMNRFFDLALLEAGDRKLELARIHMNEACSANLLAFYELLESQQIQVDVSLPEQPVYAFANAEALDRILNNLISNAVKYGNEGRMLGLKLYSDHEWVYCEVLDRGKGIAEEHVGHVFERLYTLEDSRNKQYHGSGLGLSIAKRLAEQMGGDIELRSNPYVETVFALRLPKAAGPGHSTLKK
ncbi:sensor histidine kinase [Paenibacillus sp. CAU 1782]